MYHFIGIKGSGMSSLAQIMNSLGMEVQGSDVDKYFFTEDGLRKDNIKVLPFNKDNIIDGLEIIQGNAFTDEHEEVKKAKELGLNIYTYQQMVGKLTRMFETISIAGCHGKTTTTSMLSHIIDGIYGSNYLIGDGTGHAAKDNKYFVLEACEYKRHFLEYTQKYGIITNIELDHVDYYKDIEDVKDAYTSFANNTTTKVIAWGDDPYTRTLDSKTEFLFYGLSEKNDIIAKNIEYKTTGNDFDVYINGNLYDRFHTPLCGEHIMLNSLAAITICYLEGFDKEKVKELLGTFKGAKRRFSEEAVKDNIVIDDYAHHPTEIKVTIDAARKKYPDKKLITIFQPHTFSRTKEFANQIADALNKSDASYVLEIHPSREKQEEFKEVTEELIISKLKNGYHLDEHNADALLKYNNAVILFMSPNDISILENDYKKKYGESK